MMVIIDDDNGDDADDDDDDDTLVGISHHDRYRPYLSYTFQGRARL